jgi:hypothetical protein
MLAFLSFRKDASCPPGGRDARRNATLPTWGWRGRRLGREGGSHRHLLQSLQFKFAAEKLEFYYHFVV